MSKKKNIKIKYSFSGAVALASDNNYDFDTAIYELIDNSFAADANNVVVTIHTNSDNKVIAITVEDDGKGLASKKLGIAFAPGTKKSNGINEHGIGMKAAIDHFGKLDECWSDTGKELWYLHELDPDNNNGEITIDTEESKGKPGFSIQIDCTVEGKTVYPKNYLQNPTLDSYKWGHRYADILSKPNKSLTMVYVGEDGSEKGRLDVERWFAEFDQILLNGAKIKGKNNDFEATLTVYKLTEKSNQYHPIKTATGAAGFDIVMHDRCVVTRSKAPLKGIKKASSQQPIIFTHPSYNRLYGRLVIKKGIKSTPKKDNIQENDPAFQELQELIANLWEEHKLQAYFKDELGDDASEEDIEINLMELLEERDYTNVERQKRIGYGFRTDVQGIKDDETTIWEVKKGQAVPNDVLQLVNYMKVANVSKGVLLASGFHGDCEAFKELWKVDIKFWDLTTRQYKGLDESR